MNCIFQFIKWGIVSKNAQMSTIRRRDKSRRKKKLYD